MTKPIESACPKCGALIQEDAPHGLCPKCVLANADTVPTSSAAPGPRTPPPTVGEVAAQFPDLEILELIGAGGMGAVYKARQPKLERLVALKILSGDLAQDPAFSERFNREARVLARLNHPNIVTVFDFGTKGPFFFLLMEFVDGVNLRQAMRAGRFTPAESLGLIQDICVALQFAHEEGILHRDIKPENILIDARGRVKIADFGIAKLIGKDEADDFTLTARGAVLGSPHYMAPEQIEQPEKVDERADIYSLGVVLYELLTGELPLGRFAPPSENTPMDERIDEIVMRTLEKERQRRYQSVGEVKTSVEDITRSHSIGDDEAGSGPTPTDAPLSQEETARFATLSAILTSASLLILLAVLAGSVPAFDYVGASSGISFMKLAALAFWILLIAGFPALLGFLLGAKALADIRRSEGRKRGLARAMFGSLTWPLLVIITVTSISLTMGFAALFGPGLLASLCSVVITVAAGVFVILSTWRSAQGIPRGVRSHESSRAIIPVAILATILVLMPSLAILLAWSMFTTTRGDVPQTESSSHITWRLGRPEVELALALAPMHVATVALVHTDASGKKEIRGLQGYAIASDSEPLEFKLQIGSSRKSLNQDGNRRWTLHLERPGGGHGSSNGYLSGDWEFGSQLPNKLDLTAEGHHSMIVASPARSSGDPTLSPDTLTLQVITQHRGPHGFSKATRGGGAIGCGNTDWAKDLEQR